MPILVAAIAVVVLMVSSLSADALAGQRREAPFGSSVGINVHFAYDDTAYGRRDRIARLILGLGVRHLRDGLVAGRDDVCAFDRSLGTRGIRFTFITQRNPNGAILRSWFDCTGGAAEAFEGINEYDASHPREDGEWAQTLRSSQRALYGAVKGDSRLRRLVVVGPSITTPDAARQAGDLSAWLDVGNTHDYFAGHEPETAGWGLGGYGSLEYNLRAARTISGDKQIWATETGYGTPPGENAVDEATQAAYVVRLFLIHALREVRRTFYYELVDEGGPPFATYGLVRRDLSVKPAYRAVAALMREVGTASVIPAPRAGLAVDGMPADGTLAAFSRPDRGIAFALWRVSSEAVNVRVRSRRPLRNVRILGIGADGNLSPARAISRGAPIVVRVGPRVTFVEAQPS